MSGILVLIAVTTSGSTFLTALGGAIILYGLILKLYLRTAQDLKRLEGISKFVVFPAAAAKLLIYELHMSCLKLPPPRKYIH